MDRATFPLFRQDGNRPRDGPARTYAHVLISRRNMEVRKD
jgi:hypothetical protein